MEKCLAGILIGKCTVGHFDKISSRLLISCESVHVHLLHWGTIPLNDCMNGCELFDDSIITVLIWLLAATINVTLVLFVSPMYQIYLFDFENISINFIIWDKTEKNMLQHNWTILCSASGWTWKYARQINQRENDIAI